MVSKIIRYDKLCQIVEEDDDMITRIDNLLSFRIQGAEHSKAYKGYTNSRGELITWDGKRHLMSNKGSFPPGLLERVEAFYKKRKMPLEIIDERTKPSVNKPIDISAALKKANKVPRQYQIDSAKTAVSKERGIIRIATGGGKSIVATLITAMLGKSTIIYVIGKDLLHQLHSLFTEMFDEEIGKIGDGICEIRNINIVTIWSVGKSLGLKKNIVLDDDGVKEKEINSNKFKSIKAMLLTSKVHIFDECHLAACETVQEISRAMKGEHVYGMSASPWRDDGGDLLIEAVLGNKIVDIQARWLIENGYLVEPQIRFLAVPKWTGAKRAKYPTVYSQYITESDERNALVALAAKKLTEQGFHTLVLFHSIKHGKILHELISKEIPCALLSGKDKTKIRDDVKASLEDGTIKCIIASKIFDIGVDIPKLSGLICAGAGKSSVRALQRIGRVIRPYPGKEQAAIIEFADQAPHLLNHSIIRSNIYEEEFDISWPKNVKREL